MADALAPGRNRTAPCCVLRHDAALAIGHGSFVQNPRGMLAEHREPTVLGAIGRAVGKDQRVVLVGRQQALAAAGRSEHDKRIRLRRLAVSVRLHLSFREHRRAAGHRAKLAGDDGRDIAAGETFRQQTGGDRLNAGPGARQLGRALRVTDVVAEQGRALRAHAQEIARRQRADHRAGIVDDAEMADAQPVHPADRHIGEGVGVDHRQRLAHRKRDRLAERLATARGEHAQQVALGHDAGIARAAAGDRRHAHRPTKSSRRRSARSPSPASPAATRIAAATT